MIFIFLCNVAQNLLFKRNRRLVYMKARKIILFQALILLFSFCVFSQSEESSPQAAEKDLMRFYALHSLADEVHFLQHNPQAEGARIDPSFAFEIQEEYREQEHNRPIPGNNS